MKSGKNRVIYKLIAIIVLLFIMIKVKEQLITLKKYNAEIAVLNQKISSLQNQQTEIDDKILNNSKEDNENMARKDLKMYYPNETPYKGY